MNIQIATLCKSATNFPQEEMVIVGTVDILAAKIFPLTIPQCAIALRLHMTAADNGERTLRVAICNLAGESIDKQLPVQTKLPIELAENSIGMTRNLIINFERLSFPAKGTYYLTVHLDEQELQRIPIQVFVAP